MIEWIVSGFFPSKFGFEYNLIKLANDYLANDCWSYCKFMQLNIKVVIHLD